MKQNSNSTSDTYQKKLLSASIQREAKKSKETNDLKKFQRNIFDNNDFIINIELKFENLTISRYLYDISKECDTPIRNSVQITRFIIMKSNNKIMGTCISDGIILCYSNDKDSNTILNNIIKDLEKNYYISLKLEDNVDNTSDKIEKYILSYIIQFTLVCKYLESGKWFHIWDNMDTIIESKFCGNNSCKYFNCIGFKFNILNNDYNILNDRKNNIYIIKMYLKVTINIYKILPIDDLCENMNVYCLPRCSMQATILNIFSSSDNTNFNYRDYWLHVHGYKLNEASIERIVKVKLYKGIFNYPIGVLLRDNIYKIKVPIKKEHFFYICEFLNKFELLKNSKISLLKFSENLKFDNIYNELNNDHIELKKKENEEFYNKIKSLCNNEFEETKFKEDASNKNKQDNFYNNGYNIYGNTITNSMKSINLNFSKSNKINNYNTSKSDKNIDDFLKKSSLNYNAEYNSQSKQSYLNKNENNKSEDDDSKIVNHNFNNYKNNKNINNSSHNSREKENLNGTKDNEYHKKGSGIDKYLKDVTKNYSKSLNNNNNGNTKDIDTFENISADLIFSADFQNFLDNLDEIGMPEEKLKKVDFNERDKKRPNFSISIQLNNENSNNHLKEINVAHQYVSSSLYSNNKYVENNTMNYRNNSTEKEPTEITTEKKNALINCTKNQYINTRESQNSFSKYNQKKEENSFENCNENNRICSSNNLNKESNSFNLRETQNMKRKIQINTKVEEQAIERMNEHMKPNKKKNLN